MRPNAPTPRNGHRVATDAVRFLRNYLVGLWAAGKLNMADAEAGRYAADVARFGERTSGDQAIVNLVRADIAASGGMVDRELVVQRLRGFERSAARAIGDNDAVIVYPEAA